MTILQPFLVLIAFLALVATIFLAPMVWFRSVRNMFSAIRHIRPTAYEKYPNLKWNRFNALFYSEALDEEGKKAKKELLKNLLIFIGLISITVFLCQIAGLT